MAEKRADEIGREKEAGQTEEGAGVAPDGTESAAAYGCQMRLAERQQASDGEQPPKGSSEEEEGQFGRGRPVQD